MESNTQLIKVINESKVEKATASNLEASFLPFYNQLLQWSEKAKTLIVTDDSQIREMKMAREARLALRDIRVAADKKRKDLKEDSTRYGKAVQAVYNLIEGLIVPAEKHFEEQEKFIEIKEQKRKDALRKVREIELAPYQEFVALTTYRELGEYSEQEYTTILTGCKSQLQTKIEEEAKVKEENIRLEKEKVERQGKMFELGLKWNGSEFYFKDINFHWTDLICMTTEEFDKAYTGAKERKAQLDAEALLIVVNNPLSPEVLRQNPVTINTDIPSLSETFSSAKDAVETNSPPFHCFLCGTQLDEIGQGLLECNDCFSVFLPFVDRKGNQCISHLK